MTKNFCALILLVSVRVNSHLKSEGSLSDLSGPKDSPKITSGCYFSGVLRNCPVIYGYVTLAGTNF